jgi:hypothetical protein
MFRGVGLAEQGNRSRYHAFGRLYATPNDISYMWTTPSIHYRIPPDKDMTEGSKN